MDIIFQYIKNPYAILPIDSEKVSIWHCLVSILLGALSIGSLLDTINLLFICALFSCLLIIMILNALTIDFVAQLLSKQANSITLFKGLSLSLIIIIFFKPIQLLEPFVSSTIISLLYLLGLSYFSHIQCKTIQKTYQTRGITANLLWLMPSLLTLGTIIAVWILIIQLIAPYF